MRLLARNISLPALLLTWSTLFLILGFWVVSGAAGTLLPREARVCNGPYNSALATGLAFLASFVGLPLLLFLFGGGFELVHQRETLRRWLPRPGLLRWQRTLAVAPWRRLDVSPVLYALATLIVIATLVVDSPSHYQHVHEYDLDVPSTLLFTSGVLAGPDGNIWLGLEGRRTT